MRISLKTSGEGFLGRVGGGEYNESRVVWNTFRNVRVEDNVL